MRAIVHPATVFEAALFSEVDDHAWVVWLNYLILSMFWMSVWGVGVLLFITGYAMLGLPGGITAQLIDRVLVFSVFFFWMPIVANLVKFAGSSVRYYRLGINPLDEVRS